MPPRGPGQRDRTASQSLLATPPPSRRLSIKGQGGAPDGQKFISVAAFARRSENRAASGGSVLFLTSRGIRDWRIPLPSQWINLVSRMKLVSVALLYLGSVSFFGVEAASLDVASDFKRKWSRWALSRVRRDATLTEADADAPASLVHVREATGEPSRRRREEGRLRLKRQDAPVFHTYLRMSCNLGTCVTAKLMDQIYHLNNKDKDPNAPARKISPQGYGRRRRRRSLLDVVGALKSSSSSSSRILSERRRRRRRTAPPFQALRALQ